LKRGFFGKKTIEGGEKKLTSPHPRRGKRGGVGGSRLEEQSPRTRGREREERAGWRLKDAKEREVKGFIVKTIRALRLGEAVRAGPWYNLNAHNERKGGREGR